MSACIASAVFWISVAALVYTYLGYPLLVALLARRRASEPAPAPPAEWPSLTIVLVARNEAARLPGRLENLAATDYPAGKIEIVVVSDGSSDDTVQQVERFRELPARVITIAEQRGKAAGLNAGIAAASGEIVVFADARQKFIPQTIPALARALLHPRFGAVGGELAIAESAPGIGQGIDAYWRLERALRKAEARVDSCIGCSGAIYAIRRQLYIPLPEDTILDDVVVPMQIAAQGWRIGFCEEAQAFDPQPLAPETEKRRKQRTLAGNFQMLFRYPAWLLPWRNRLWWQLLSHKYLRLTGPVFLAAAAAANALLLDHPFYQITAALQCAFYVFAAIGMFCRARIFSIPASFVFLNLHVLRGFAQFLSGETSRGWAR